MKKDRLFNENEKKISVKDIAIISLSVIAFIMLVFILLLSRKSDKEKAQQLVQDNATNSVSQPELVKEDTVESDVLIFTEANGSGWIELYNNSKRDISLDGYTAYLAGEKVAEFGKNDVIHKMGYFAFDIPVNPGEKTTNVFLLKNKNENNVLTVLIPNLDKEESYGRRTVESYEMGYVVVSKNEANPNPENYVCAYYGGIGFSVPSGFYSSEFELELSSYEGETIYYTLDGSSPSVESQKYEKPIHITNKSGSNYVYAKLAFGYEERTNYFPSSVDCGTVVRAIKTNSQGKIIGEMTQTYYLGISKDVDYLNLPVLSVTSNPDNFFDYFDGIYVPGRTYEDGVVQDKKDYGNYLNGWVRPAYVEYFEPDKGKSFESTVLCSINGDSYMSSSQKGLAFSITADDYHVYEGSSLCNFIANNDTFRVTSFYSDNTMKLREYLINFMVDDSAVLHMDMQPCIVFIDGEYWGLYTLRSPVDQKYIERCYGIPAKDIYLYNARDYASDFEDFYNEVLLTDMSIPENYEKLKLEMDIDSYQQYVCTYLYMANTRFGSANYAVWKTRENKGTGFEDGKWRWTLGSMDSTIALSKNSSKSIDTYLQKNVLRDPFFQSLLMNKEFCDSLLSTMKSMGDNEFNESHWRPELERLVALLKKPAIASYKRFYGNLDDDTYMWEISRIESFLQNRYDYISVYTAEVAEKGGNAEAITAYFNGEDVEDSMDDDLNYFLHNDLDNVFSTFEGEVLDGQD